jgi:hypothetical protein
LGKIGEEQDSVRRNMRREGVDKSRAGLKQKEEKQDWVRTDGGMDKNRWENIGLDLNR